MYGFGSGVLIGTPSGANPTPINFGLIQEVTIDFSSTNKPLYGQGRYAKAMGAGTIKVTGKAKMARISGLAFGTLFHGIVPSAGQNASIMGEAGTVPGTSTYTITVANSATFTGDLGVVYAGTGLPLKEVASGPTIGQYSYAAGVYTFAAADANAAMLISYQYTVSATGQKISITNPLLGATVNFALNLYGLDPTNGKSYSLQLNNAVSSKLTFGTKLEDFIMPELDFDCYANAADVVGQWNFGDAA